LQHQRPAILRAIAKSRTEIELLSQRYHQAVFGQKLSIHEKLSEPVANAITLLLSA